MEVLNEKQQLINRKEEVLKAIQYQDHLINKKREYKCRYEDRWFFKTSSTLRLLNFEIDRLEGIYKMLLEYNYSLGSRITKIKDDVQDIKS